MTKRVKRFKQLYAFYKRNLVIKIEAFEKSNKVHCNSQVKDISFKLRYIKEVKTKVGKYIMLSTLTDEGRKTLKMRPERIKEVNKEIDEMGVKVLSQYAVLGPYDFVNIVEAPSNEAISRVAIELGSRGTVKIMTLAAIPIDDFVRKLK